MDVTRTVTRSSRLAAPAERVWAHATSMASITREMAPWLRMTFPPEAAGVALDDPRVRLGEPLFTSWVLLLGVVPVERMDLTLAELDPGRRFVEQSRTRVLKGWRHERRVEPDGDGCVVTDTLTLTPPVGALAGPLEWFVGRFFEHRHRRLRALFG